MSVAIGFAFKENFENFFAGILLLWTDPTPLGQEKSRGEVGGAIKRAFDAAAIEIPFPYRTMTFKEPLMIQRQAKK